MKSTPCLELCLDARLIVHDANVGKCLAPCSSLTYCLVCRCGICPPRLEPRKRVAQSICVWPGYHACAELQTVAKLRATRAIL